MTARASTIAKFVVNGIIPAVPPTAEEVADALKLPGMNLNDRPAGQVSAIATLVPACGNDSRPRTFMLIRASVIAAAMAFAVLSITGCAAAPVQVIPTAYIDDRVITSTIKARHAQSKAVAITGITVETLYGVVLLTGFVESPQEKMTAQHIASEVDGVKAIHNEIVIQGDITARDTAPSDRASPFLYL